MLLRNACATDHEEAATLVDAADLKLPEKSLTTCIDASGIYYRIPIACINDPLAYDKDHLLESMKNQSKPAKANVKGIKLKFPAD